MIRLDKLYRIEKNFQFNEIMIWNRNKSLKLTTFNRKKGIFFSQHLQDKTADFYTWPLQNINRYIQKLSITNSTTKNIVEVVTPILPSISNIALKSSFETHTTPGMKVLKHFFLWNALQLLQFLNEFVINNFGFSEQTGNTTGIHLNWRFRTLRYIGLTHSVIPVKIPSQIPPRTVLKIPRRMPTGILCQSYCGICSRICSKIPCGMSNSLSPAFLPGNSLRIIFKFPSEFCLGRVNEKQPTLLLEVRTHLEVNDFLQPMQEFLC